MLPFPCLLFDQLLLWRQERPALLRARHPLDSRSSLYCCSAADQCTSSQLPLWHSCSSQLPLSSAGTPLMREADTIYTQETHRLQGLRPGSQECLLPMRLLNSIPNGLSASGIQGQRALILSCCCRLLSLRPGLQISRPL